MNVDKRTTIDSTQWLSIHLYVVLAWKRIPILCVDGVGMFATIDNVFVLMLKYTIEFGGLELEDLGPKLVNMGCDENNVFQGPHMCHHAIQKKIGLCIINVHCFAPKINLIVVTLSNLP
jgi:hypothetical protein